MSAQAKPLNPPAPRRSAWAQARETLETPLLAILTALALGGVMIIVSDLAVMGEFRGTFSRLAPTGTFRLIMALAFVGLGGWLYFGADATLKRLNKNFTGWPLTIARFVGGLGSLVIAYFFLRGAGFATALDGAWSAVSVAYGAMAEGSLGNASEMAAALQSGEQKAILNAFYPILDSLVAATPLIFAGLSVALGFQCGLFNIGAQGQLVMGAIFSAYIGYAVTGLPAFIHIPLALLAGALGGAVWAFLPAILKAKVGTHEVINTIMLNWIAVRLSEWLLNGPMKRPDISTPVSPPIAPSAELPVFFPDPIRFHLGFFIALGVALFIWWFLFRTTWGFEIRTVGLNPNAARYAGMSITRNYVIAFCLAGALAGLAGANEVLGVNHNLAVAFAGGTGFDAIALALLGKSHPAGVVVAALLFGTLQSGGTRMQNVAKIPVDIIFVVQALVIAFIAAPAIIRTLYRYREERAPEKR